MFTYLHSRHPHSAFLSEQGADNYFRTTHKKLARFEMSRVTSQRLRSVCILINQVSSLSNSLLVGSVGWQKLLSCPCRLLGCCVPNSWSNGHWLYAIIKASICLFYFAYSRKSSKVFVFEFAPAASLCAVGWAWPWTFYLPASVSLTLVVRVQDSVPCENSLVASFMI